MTNKEKVLNFLRANNGVASRSDISGKVFQRHLSATELDTLLATVLSGLVEVKNKKWTLTAPMGWREANLLAGEQTAPEPQPTQQDGVTEGFSRFKAIVEQNSDSSLQRCLQLAGRHIGDPLTDSECWREFRKQNPEWYLQQPRAWYAPDVELTEDYPTRYPESPLTAKERDARPTNETGWFNRAMRQTGASLEPLAAEMSAAECANVIRVTRKIGQEAAQEVFGPGVIATAHRLAGLTAGENLIFSASSTNPLKA